MCNIRIKAHTTIFITRKILALHLCPQVLQNLAFSGFLELHFLQWAHNFRLGIATNRPWEPPINFKSRMTNAPSMVIEQKAMSLSAVFSISLILTSVISMAFPHWPYHHHPNVGSTSCYSIITKSDSHVTQARAEWQLHKAIQQLRDS